jgi:hypothetical protein
VCWLRGAHTMVPAQQSAVPAQKSGAQHIQGLTCCSRGEDDVGDLLGISNMRWQHSRGRGRRAIQEALPGQVLRPQLHLHAARPGGGAERGMEPVRCMDAGRE